MPIAGRSSVWNGPQLAARWLAARGPLPEPVRYAIYRDTIRPGGDTTATYRIQDEPQPFGPQEFTVWRGRNRLGGAAGLGLAVLVIREVLDTAGFMRECIIERRRGTIDGPLAGDPARIEFIGPVRSVRLYVVDSHGRLVESTPSSPPLPQAPDITDAFGGEEAALRAHFGPSAIVLDRRSPTLFEELAGLSSIVHVRHVGGDVGCGIGWHGPMAYLLIGDFPRLDHGLALPPSEEGSVAEALRRNKLTRHEMRLDSDGLCVIASKRDTQALFIVRPDEAGARVEPYTPNHGSIGSEDQQRWIHYAEDHERRIVLDAYQDGASDELVVLTGDDNGQVWRHRIDDDGVEVACGPANETAVAMLYRARRTPNGANIMATTDPDDIAESEGWPELPPEADSLLAKARAYAEASLALRKARAAKLSWPATAACLREMDEPLRVLGARGAATALRGFLRRGDRSSPADADRLRGLDAVE
jgi:hypothetical protein